MGNETHIFGLTDRKANALILNILQAKETDTSQHVTCGFTSDLPTGEAKTTLSLYQDPIMQIGKQGLTTLSGKISDQKFITMVLAIHHEFRHIEQDYQTRTGVPEKSRLAIPPEVITANIAYRNNQEYYQATYLCNIQEMDAEIYGILATQKTLETQFPDIPPQKHQELLLGIINDLNQNPKTDYWLKRHTTKTITSIEQLEKTFSTTADMYLHEPKKSQFHKKPNLIDDEFYRVTQGSISVRNTWGPILYQFRRNMESGTGADFDRMLACVTLYAHPDYMARFKAAQDLDLSPQTIFGRDFPESQRSVMARLNISPNPIRTHRKKLLPKREPGKRILDDTRTFTDNVHAAKTSIHIWTGPSRTKTRGDQLLEQQLRAKAQGLQQISPPNTELDDPTNPYN